MWLYSLATRLFDFNPKTYFEHKGRVSLSKQVFDYRPANLIERDARELLWRIYRQTHGIDTIIGILRGSAYPWRVATDVFDGAEFYFIRVESYTGVGKSVEPRITQGVPRHAVEGKRVLVME